MAWLSSEECLEYAPGIQLTGDALTSAIAIAQILAEGINGANRPLEITSISKVIRIPLNGRITLPIRPLLTDPAPVVQMRGSQLSSRFNAYSDQEWETLATTDYVIDVDNAEIALLGLNRLIRQDTFYTGFRRFHRPPTMPFPVSQAKIIYSSGFDFDDNSTEIIALKTALANIVAARESPHVKGVKSLEISDEEYKITYASASEYAGISNKGGGVNGSIINEYLSIFHQYRPVEFAL